MDNQLIVSVTERESFHRCPQQWHYGSLNRRGLALVEAPSFHLSVGSICHHGVDVLAVTRDVEKMQASVDEFIERLHEKAVKEYEQFASSFPSGGWQAEWKELSWLSRQMLGYYVERYGTDPFEPFELIGSEVTFLIEVPGTDSLLTGTIDRVLQDRYTGQIWVGETKTFSQAPDPALLQQHDQMGKYLWALTQLLPNEEVGGALYDGLSKEIPRKPRVLPSNGKLSREAIPTTPALFREAMAEIGADEDDEYYVEHLAKLDSQFAQDVGSFFIRHKLRWTPAQHAQSQNDLVAEIKAMEYAHKNDVVFPVQWFSWMYDSCHRCPFYEPCFSHMRGEYAWEEEVLSTKYVTLNPVGYTTGEMMKKIKDKAIEPSKVSSIDDLRGVLTGRSALG